MGGLDQEDGGRAVRSVDSGNILKVELHLIVCIKQKREP